MLQNDHGATIKELSKRTNGLIGARTHLQRSACGQKRKSGEPYFKHPLATEVLQSWHLDEATVAAGFARHRGGHGVPLDTSRKNLARKWRPSLTA